MVPDGSVSGSDPASGGADSLLRVIGLPGAVAMGLGSIVGTGLFVSLGIAAGVAGSALLLALPLAALLALFNGLSSAQLAAAHPVSGGTYAYGTRFLSPGFGFAAGTMFLLAKSASAATAALGLAGYILVGLGTGNGPAGRIALAAAAVLLLTALTAGGIRRSNRVNVSIVGVTLVVFLLFVGAGAVRGSGWILDLVAGRDPGSLLAAGGSVVARWFRDAVVGPGAGPLLHATALLFVAYTGYGRIATLGEEVRDPARTIPRAIWITVGTVALLYMGVAATAVFTLGAEEFARETARTAAPLQAVARVLAMPGLVLAVSVAAVTAMLGVLLNLILGLSRVAFAMGRQGDLPGAVGRVHASSGSPRLAVWLTGAVILGLVLLGDVRTTWSFSAFTVLLYYGITNLAALRLPAELRLYPRWVPAAGLLGCLLLAFHVPPVMWAAGLGLLALAFAGRQVGRRRG
jgi:basic amino acid/polyamine antiporter, APA family